LKKAVKIGDKFVIQEVSPEGEFRDLLIAAINRIEQALNLPLTDFVEIDKELDQKKS